jgi:hypothetical protein
MAASAAQREVEVTVERGRFPVLRVSPTVPASERSGRRGPLFYVRDDLEELLAFTGTRCRLAGAASTLGGISDTWRCAFMVTPSDVEPVVFALDALLAGDDQPLRSYMRNAPDVSRAGDAHPWGV